MSTTPSEAQIHSKLDLAVSLLEGIRSDGRTNRLFDVLEIVRDEVNGLSRGHESIRSDIREVINVLIQQQTMGAG